MNQLESSSVAVLASVAIVSLTLFSRASSGDDSHAGKDAVTGDRNVPKYGLFEVSLTTKEQFANPFRDPKVHGEFTSPDGKRYEAEGFYHGGERWCVRFSPNQEGEWTYLVSMAAPGGLELRKSGTFLCEGASGHGPLRLSKRNPYRMEYADGTPFYPIGLQNCGYFNVGFDGPTEDGKWRSISPEQWCKEFQGGANLLRWQLGAGTRQGCALPLIPIGGQADRYDTELATKMDDLFRLQKNHGFSHIVVLFQDMSLWSDDETAFGKTRQVEGYKSLTSENLPVQEDYIRYVVARFGCFVDIWEIFNEDMWAPGDYLRHLAKVIRQADPYDHIITTNYPRPREEWCEIIAPHKYFRIPANDVDVYLAKEIGRYKSFGKVVQYTESGNKGWLPNYDPVKWRLAAWTAFINESGMLYWNMSGRKTTPRKARSGGNANTYIGPETRRAFRVLNEFTRGLPIEMRPIDVSETEPHDKIRTYALSNGDVSVIYAHHYRDYEVPFSHRTRLVLDAGPGKFKFKWISPADGSEIFSDELETSNRVLRIPIPRFTIDAACRVDRAK